MKRGIQSFVGLCCLLFVLVWLVAACSSNEKGQDGGHSANPPPVSQSSAATQPPASTQTSASTQAPTPSPSTSPPKPVELVAYNMSGDMDYDRYMELYGSHMQKKHPHLSFQFLTNKDEAKFANMVATKQKIDIFYGTTNGYQQIVDAKYTEFDVSELVKKHNIDLSRIEPAAYELFLKMNNGVLNAFPVALIHSVLGYNQDLFDKFGVPYLENGITWDETYEKAKLLSRKEDGVQYMGFAIQNLSRLFDNNQYGEEMIDSNTGKARVNVGKWPDMFRQFTSFYAIAGNEFPGTNATAISNLFLKDKVLAMNIILNSQFVGSNYRLEENLHYDVVQLPVFLDTQGVGGGASPNFFAVSSTSEHKEDAFLAVVVLLSEEVQAERARVSGSYPIVQISDIEKIMASELPHMNGKNIVGLLPAKFAAINMPAPAGVNTAAALTAAYADISTGSKDVNTALREANERLDQELEAAKAASSQGQ